MREQIKTEMAAAMRDGDATRLATLRLMHAAIKDRDIAARGEEGAAEAAPAAVIELLTKMIKQREDAATLYEENGRLELAERERAEIAVIKGFLPEPLSEAEAAQVVADAIEAVGATGIRDMGRVMAALKRDYVGRLDFTAVGARVKAALGAGG